MQFFLDQAKLKSVFLSLVSAAPEKRLRFRTVEDAPEQQVLDAMKKIALHIKSPAKFSKASKLAIQLIQAGSVKPTNCDYFFSILESAMSCPTACTDQSLRSDFHALFTAAQDADEVRLLSRHSYEFYHCLVFMAL